MLDPQRQKKLIDRLEAHVRCANAIIIELRGEGTKQNAKVKKLSYEQEADIEAKLRSKVIS
jgi:hypothetical protein